MFDLFESAPVLLCGREFTFQELEEIQETVRMFQSLSRKELALTVCENLEWFSPNGRLKVESCSKLLTKLETLGFLKLPELRKTIKGLEKPVIPGAKTNPEAPNWIGWTQADRSQKLHLVINNTRFLIFPWVNIKNLASRALSLSVKRIRSDWQARYGYQPVLLETFVDREKYRGTCYLAANWQNIGETIGRGRMDRYREYLSSPPSLKTFARP
ncbi:hypothetical protein JCM15765_09680 [Paradesulfitobacterium aromaticivorans]